MKHPNSLKNNSWQVNAMMPITYPVFEYPDIFSSDDPNLFGDISADDNPRRIVIIDKVIAKLYSKKIKSYFKKHSIAATYVVLEVSEEKKSFATLTKVLQQLETFRPLRRKEPIIVIGGGVLLDIVGLAANLHRRGTPYIRIPTTLVGLVDAGIGVKTGINYNNHKNRIGTYFHPAAVFIDQTFLQTLDTRHISNGLAEILKIALIKDKSLFTLLDKYGENLVETNFQNTATADILDKAIKGMLEELEPNLWEHNLTRLVDFGHTFSTGLEMNALPALLHGEAVNIDMALSSVIARQRRLITESELHQILMVMKKMKLPIFYPNCTEELLYKTLKDSTAHRDGQQRCPLLNGIGNAVFVNDITRSEIALAVKTLKETSKNLMGDQHVFQHSSIYE